MRKILPFLIALLLLSACSSNGDSLRPTTEPLPSVDTSPTPSPDFVAATDPGDAAGNIIQALMLSDMTALKANIHPTKGLLFSPYAHIDTGSAKVFTADHLPALSDSTIYEWGVYDGSGEPISLTFKQYFDKFVYDQNFIESETVGIDQIKREENMMVNIKEVYPDSYVMDYYFSGFDEQYKGMDWESLILVLETFNGGWYLSAIVHSQWTI